MKKIVPFKKDIIFKSRISEITSISLDHTLHIDEGNIISGKFIVSGDYLLTDESVNTEAFSYELPFLVSLDERYILDEVVIDIDDFYYEIVDENVLSVNIDVLIDKLNEKLVPDIDGSELIERKIEREDILKDEVSSQKLNEEDISTEPIKQEEDNNSKRCIEEEDPKSECNETNNITAINSLFDNLDSSSETFKSYSIYIVRENDSIEAILEKYKVSRELLLDYNDLNGIKIGDKIIIPSE